MLAATTQHMDQQKEHQMAKSPEQEKADAQAAYDRVERQAREARTDAEMRAVIDAFSTFASQLKRR